MGLDIFHYKMVPPPADLSKIEHSFRLSENPELEAYVRARFPQWIFKRTREYIDWEATFAKLNLTYADFEWQGSWGTSEGEYANHFTSLIDGTQVSIQDDSEVINQVEADEVAYVEAGYMRKGMSEVFYASFGNCEYVIDKAKVKSIALPSVV